MGWGLGGSPGRLGSCCSRAPPRPWRPLPLREPGCGQPRPGLGGRGRQSLLSPGRAETSRGEDALPVPSGAASPFPPTISGRQRQPHSCYGNPGLQAAAGSAGKEGSATPRARGTPGRTGRGSEEGQPGVRGQRLGAGVSSPTSGFGKAPGQQGVRLGLGI